MKQTKQKQNPSRCKYYKTQKCSFDNKICGRLMNGSYCIDYEETNEKQKRFEKLTVKELERKIKAKNSDSEIAFHALRAKRM